jgi:Smg protein
MNHSVLDVLMYLFETYSDDEHDQATDNNVLRQELLRAGFGEPEIERALDWLEDLNWDPQGPLPAPPADRSVRVYNSQELQRLDASCRGYLLHLEQIGVLPPLQRELVIDRLMALGPAEIDVEQVKWVVLMVLFSQPGPDSGVAQVEDLVFEESSARVN